MKQPLVSVCIPTFNGSLYLKDALDSITLQSYNNLEIIISDDASSDDTLDIIENFKSQTNLPLELFHHKPSGIGANWNNCLKYAQGEYIKYLFQDDVMEPNCIEKMVAALQKNPKVALVTCQRHFIIENSYHTEKVEDWLTKYGNLQKHLNLDFNPNAIIDKTIFKSAQFYKLPVNIIGEPTAVMFRKKFVNTMGLFRTDLKQHLDCEYWFRILKYSSILILNEKLIHFRLHASQATNQNKIKLANDSELMSQILYEEYFWLVNMHRKKQLFLKYNVIGKLINKFMRG